MPNKPDVRMVLYGAHLTFFSVFNHFRDGAGKITICVYVVNIHNISKYHYANHISCTLSVYFRLNVVRFTNHGKFTNPAAIT